MQNMSIDFEKLFPKYPDVMLEEEVCMEDYNYFKRIYPRQLRLICTVVEEYLDRYEYEGSPIYMQYPDQVTIYRMATDIFSQFQFEGNDDELSHMKDMIGILVCQEIYVRRRRHDRFCRRF